MVDALTGICATKREHVAARKSVMPLAEVEAAARRAPPPRGFLRALQSRAGRYGLIAEIKKASPSKGLIREDFDPPDLAEAYERAGADCLSVLTDVPYFQGADEHLAAARGAASLPVLRKDFMIDPYQIAEARMLGADCVLLIMAALEDGLAAELEVAATAWGMDALVEVHDEEEMERAFRLNSPLLGINNRNLKTLKTDLDTTRTLAPRAGDRFVVSESGLRTAADLDSMYEAGARCFLIGESLMSRPDVESATRALVAGHADS